MLRQEKCEDNRAQILAVGESSIAKQRILHFSSDSSQQTNILHIVTHLIVPILDFLIVIYQKLARSIKGRRVCQLICKRNQRGQAQ